jgi:hypothetical protein
MMFVIFSLIVAAEMRHAKRFRAFVVRTNSQMQAINRRVEERRTNDCAPPHVAELKLSRRA